MVIDSTDRERLAVTREELYTLLQHEDLSKACLLVYANKQVSVGWLVICSIRNFLFELGNCNYFATQHINFTRIEFRFRFCSRFQDLKGAMSAAEISRQLDLTSIKKHQWHIQSCCALTGDG